MDDGAEDRDEFPSEFRAEVREWLRARLEGDYAEVRGTGVVTGEVAIQALDLLQVDHAGLDRLDREILRAICEKFSGGPVGLSTLAVAVGEEQDTIEDVYEPYLLQRGLIERTPRGRAATRRAFAHLGLEPPGPLALL